MRTVTVVCAPEHSPDVDVVACQHIILRDAQHLLRPWNDDALAMDTETQAVTSSPAQLLHQTAHGTVSGLCFIDAVEGTGTTLPVRACNSIVLFCAIRHNHVAGHMLVATTTLMQ
jgi:hypothetical protein